MRDTDLYRQVLGLDKPWTVGHVGLDVAGQRVDIWVVHESGTVWNCPQCGRELSCRDHAEERIWRHLNTCQFHHNYDALEQSLFGSIPTVTGRGEIRRAQVQVTYWLRFRHFQKGAESVGGT